MTGSSIGADPLFTMRLLGDRVVADGPDDTAEIRLHTDPGTLCRILTGQERVIDAWLSWPARIVLNQVSAARTGWLIRLIRPDLGERELAPSIMPKMAALREVL